MPFASVRQGVVIEAAIQELVLIWDLIDVVKLSQMPVNQLPYRFDNIGRVGIVDVRSDIRQAFQEIAAVN